MTGDYKLIGNGYDDGLRKAIEPHKDLNEGQPTTNNDKGAVGDERARNECSCSL